MIDCPLSKCPMLKCPLIAERCGRCEIEKPKPEYGSFTDPRDGRTYRTVKIGKQVWMAENLAFDYAGSKVYNNDLANLDKYGRLYDWETAKKACPPGWHLPSNAEWDGLFRLCDGSEGTESPYASKTAGKFLKAKEGWNEDEGVSGNGTDDYGFSALPGGRGFSGGFFNFVGYYGRWWSASEYGSNDAYYRYMNYNYEYASYSSSVKSNLFSVRCLQDVEAE